MLRNSSTPYSRPLEGLAPTETRQPHAASPASSRSVAEQLDATERRATTERERSNARKLINPRGSHKLLHVIPQRRAAKP